MSNPGELSPDQDDTLGFPLAGDSRERTQRLPLTTPGEATVRLTPQATGGSDETTTIIHPKGGSGDTTVNLAPLSNKEKTVVIPQEIEKKVGDVSLLKDRVRAELGDILDRPSYYSQLHRNRPNWTKLNEAAASYINTYGAVRSRIIPHGVPETDVTLEDYTLALWYDMHTVGTVDGTDFRRVVMGLAPAARIDVRQLSPKEDFPSIHTDPLELSMVHEARPDGGLPHVGFVAPFGDEYATDGSVPGYAYNLEAIQIIAEANRDIFNQLGFTEADPAALATAVFSSRTLAASKDSPAHSIIATKLLLGHSLSDTLFSDLERQFQNGQPNDWEGSALLREAQKILTEAQFTLFHKVVEAPGSAQALGLLDNEAAAEMYAQHDTLHELVWDNTALTGFLFSRRLELTGEVYYPHVQRPDQDWFRTY